MKVFDDNQDMGPQDDELLLTGHALPGDGALVDLLDSLRTMAQTPAPAPTARLAALLKDGLPPRAARAPLPVVVGRAVRRRATAAGRWVAGLGLAGKVVLGAGVAMAGVTGAATIPAVPDVVQQPAHTVLTDVGRVFGGGGVSPVPAPSASSSVEPREAEPATSADPREAQDRPASGTTGTEDLGTSGVRGTTSGHQDARTETAPGRSGSSGGSDATPGQQSSSGEGSSGGQGSSTEQGSSGQESTSTVPSWSNESGNGWMRKQAPAPTRTPEPSATPRADAGAAPASSDR